VLHYPFSQYTSIDLFYLPRRLLTGIRLHDISDLIATYACPYTPLDCTIQYGSLHTQKIGGGVGENSFGASSFGQLYSACKLFTLLSTPHARLNVDGTVLMRPLSQSVYSAAILSHIVSTSILSFFNPPLTVSHTGAHQTRSLYVRPFSAFFYRESTY
jgi:hypothetical protein